VTVTIALSWWRERNETIAFHAQHGDAARHVFASAIRGEPAELIARQTRELGSVSSWLGGNETTDKPNFFSSEDATTVLAGPKIREKGVSA
jgi:hypothetical protein